MSYFSCSTTDSEAHFRGPDNEGTAPSPSPSRTPHARDPFSNEKAFHSEYEEPNNISTPNISVDSDILPRIQAHEIANIQIPLLQSYQWQDNTTAVLPLGGYEDFCGYVESYEESQSYGTAAITKTTGEFANPSDLWAPSESELYYDPQFSAHTYQDIARNVAAPMNYIAATGSEIGDLFKQGPPYPQFDLDDTIFDNGALAPKMSAPISELSSGTLDHCQLSPNPSCLTLRSVSDRSDRADMSRAPSIQADSASHFPVSSVTTVSSDPANGIFVLDFSPPPQLTAKQKTPGKRKDHPMAEVSELSRKISRKRGQNGAVCVRCKMFREKCSGSFPCEKCSNLKLWKHICVRARFKDLVCYDRNIWAHRLKPQLENARLWYDSTTVTPVKIRVGTGYKPQMTLVVNKYHPLDKGLLDHFPWRVFNIQSIKRIPSEPWGLYHETLTTDRLNNFIDQMTPELLHEESFQRNDKLWIAAFETAYARSKIDIQTNRSDAGLLRDCLRIWTAQSFWFGRIWQITSGGARIGATWREETNARDPPKMLYVQLDYSMEVYITALEKRVLHELERFVFGRTPGTWFSVFLAAFVYLAALEGDCWRLEKWQLNMSQWEALSPVDKEALPLPHWQLKMTPAECLQQNSHHAKVIVAHIRAGCKGAFPFMETSSGKVSPRTSSRDKDLIDFVDLAGRDLRNLGQALQHKHATTLFRDDDPDCLKYTLVAQLLTDNTSSG